MLRLSVPSPASERARRQRIRALKRSIPPRRVKRALRIARPRASRPCPVVADELAAWLVIGLGLFCGDAVRQVWRWLVPSAAGRGGRGGRGVPPRNTLCVARQRLGPRVLVELARLVLRPLAGPATGGACYDGMPLRGIDCCNLSLFDSPANRAAFSPPRPPKRKRKGKGRGRGRGKRRPPPAFPQAKLCCLCELGTHAMLGWGLKPMRWADCNMAPPLLRRLEAGQLVLWDAGFYTPANLDLVLGRHAHLLGRLNWSLKPKKVRTLADGSYLAHLPLGRRGKGRRRRAWSTAVVRVIEYELRGTHSARHKRHRLVTTLLDDARHPARELAELYHTRWELELAIDEVETHQLQQRVLASQTPAGVVQEVAGLLIAHWLVRQLMFEASTKAGVAPVRISFTGTLKLLRCRLGEAGDTPGRQRRWWDRLVREVAADERLEPRRPRVNPRVLKRTTFDFPKRRPHHKPGVNPPFRQAFAILR
jgi:hypothetical protein